MLFKRTLAATAIVLGTAFAANAADIPTIVAPPPAPPPVVMAPAADWTGAYFGVWGAATFFPPVFFNVGTVGGYDVQFGRVVAGVNFRGGITLGPGAINVEAGARIGFLLGDRILAYGNAAYGFLFGPGVGPYYSFGGGVEFAANETLHIFAEVRRSVLFCCGPNVSVHAGITLR